MRALFVTIMRPFILCAAAALAACATTTTSTTWMNQDYMGKRISKVLVAGISQQEVLRRKYEDAMCSELESRGSVCVPSYKIISTEEIKDKKKLEGMVKGQQFDTILISRIVGKKKETIQHPEITRVSPGVGPYVPPPYAYAGWYDYYAFSYEIIKEPSYTEEQEIMVVETNLYDVKSGKLIWSMLTETVLDSNVDRLVKDFVKVAIKNLEKENLI